MATSDSIEKETTSARWTSQGWVPTWAYIPVHNERHQLVCSVYPPAGSYDDAARNARLIAAAPELYEALSRALAGWGLEKSEPGLNLMEIEKQMKTALARARGEDRSHEGK